MSRLGWVAYFNESRQLKFPLASAYRDGFSDERAHMNNCGISMLVPGQVAGPTYHVVGSRDGKLVLREAAPSTR